MPLLRKRSALLGLLDGLTDAMTITTVLFFNYGNVFFLGIPSGVYGFRSGFHTSLLDGFLSCSLDVIMVWDFPVSLPSRHATCARWLHITIAWISS